MTVDGREILKYILLWLVAQILMCLHGVPYVLNWIFNADCIFLCPRDRRSEGILFLSCLSFCHSVILSFCPLLWNLNLANNFWTVIAIDVIFHMNIPCDKTFPWVPLFFTLVPWPWSFTLFLKTLTLLITFEQWVLELWHFTWVFLVMRPFCWY